MFICWVRSQGQGQTRFNIDSRPSGGIIFDFIAFHSVADRPSHVSRLRRRESRPSNRPLVMSVVFVVVKVGPVTGP